MIFWILIWFIYLFLLIKCSVFHHLTNTLQSRSPVFQTLLSPAKPGGLISHHALVFWGCGAPGFITQSHHLHFLLNEQSQQLSHAVLRRFPSRLRPAPDSLFNESRSKNSITGVTMHNSFCNDFVCWPKNEYRMLVFKYQTLRSLQTEKWQSHDATPRANARLHATPRRTCA